MRYRANTKDCAFRAATPPWRRAAQATRPIKRRRAGSSFRGSQKIGEKGGVERKLALALVRSFFALSIEDNNLLFSLPCLGSYHWLRTRCLLRLQKTNSSLAPLPLLRFAAFSRRSLRREKPPRPYGVVSGRAAQNVPECDLPLHPLSPRVRYLIR